MLDGVGVTPEQERTYRVLVEHPGAEVSQLVTQTGLDEHHGGVQFWTPPIYERSVLDVPGHLKHIQTMQEHGEISRVLPALPMKIVIADRSVALLPLTTGDGGEHQTWALVHPSELLDGLLAPFDALFTRAVPLRLATPNAANDDEVGRNPHNTTAVASCHARNDDPTIPRTNRVKRRKGTAPPTVGWSAGPHWGWGCYQ